MFKFSNKLQKFKGVAHFELPCFWKKSNNPPTWKKICVYKDNQKKRRLTSFFIFGKIPPPFLYVLEETLETTKWGADHKFYHGFRVFSLRTGRMFSIEPVGYMCSAPLQKTLSCVPRLTFDCGELVAYIFNE